MGNFGVAAEPQDLPDNTGKPEPKRQGKRRKVNGGEGTPSPPKPAASADDDKQKRCKKCKKSKSSAEFYQNQAGCKQCSKDLKNLENHAKRSNELEWFRNLDEAGKDSLVLAYNKEKDKADKERSRVKFNLSVYKERVVQQSGLRKEGRRRFMTEAAFYVWSKTAEGGSLSQGQAEAKWNDMLNDAKVPSQGEGIGLQLAVRIYDDLVDYDDHSKQHEVERQSKLNAKLGEKELAQTVSSLVTSRPGLDDTASASFHAAVAAAGAPEGAAGVVIPKLETLQKRRSRGADEREDADDREDAQQSPASSPKAAEPSAKWFDVAEERARARRQLESFLSKKRSAMTTLCSNIREAQDNARAEVASSNQGGGATAFVIEMKILTNRQEALELIRQGPEKEFAAYVKKFQQDHDARSTASSAHDNRLAFLSIKTCLSSLVSLFFFVIWQWVQIF